MPRVVVLECEHYLTVRYCLPVCGRVSGDAGGWQQGDGGSAPVKGVLVGLAVDGRGIGVGEAFASMRVDFASGVAASPAALEGPTLSASLLLHQRSLSIGVRTTVTHARCPALCVCYLLLSLHFSIDCTC